MEEIVIEAENLGKQYRLGLIGTGTLSHDLNRWWHITRGKEDPYNLIGQETSQTNTDSNKFIWAIKNINLKVHKGEALGIIGKNGAGKSTLLKIFSRVTGPSTGIFKAKGRIASLLEVGTGFHQELTGRENIFLNGAILGMTKNEIRSKFDEIVEFSGIEKYIDTPAKRYSSGMYVRLAFAVAAHLDSEILIADEVLAVGDAEFQKKCLGKMKDVAGMGRTVLFVSHNMHAVKSFCNRVMYLKNGHTQRIGPVNEIISDYLGGERMDKKIRIFKDDEFNHWRFTLNGIELITSNKDEKSITMGDYFSLKISLIKKMKEFHLDIDCEITDSEGNVLLVSNSESSTPVTDNYNKIGNLLYICKFPPNIFNEGDFGINLLFKVNKKRIVEQLHEIITFSVLPGSIMFGQTMEKSKGYFKLTGNNWELKENGK